MFDKKTAWIHPSHLQRLLYPLNSWNSSQLLSSIIDCANSTYAKHDRRTFANVVELHFAQSIFRQFLMYGCFCFFLPGSREEASFNSISLNFLQGWMFMYNSSEKSFPSIQTIVSWPESIQSKSIQCTEKLFGPPLIHSAFVMVQTGSEVSNTRFLGLRRSQHMWFWDFGSEIYV